MNIEGAERKLRQATLFLGHLEESSRKALRTAGQEEEDARRWEILESYFSACLSAAQSVYYVLDSTGGSAFKEAQHRWRAQLSEPDRSWFGRMIGLRDDDVHLALTRGKALPKYIAEDWRTRSTSPYYQTQFYNAAIFGPAPVVEMKNPDGTLVKGSALHSAVGLYIERQGQLVEATDACREFIRQLATLLDAVKSTAE